MNPWLIIGLIGAGIVFGLDYIVRRKKWDYNTEAERKSLLLNMISVSVYAFSSVAGILWGITGSNAVTPFGAMLYEVTLIMAGFIWLVTVVATLGSIILRKKGKTKESIWINILALIYIVVSLGVNALTGLI